MTTESVGAEGAPMDDAAMFDALASGQDLPEESAEVVAEAPQPEPEAVEQVQEQPPQVVEPPQQDHRVPLRELLDEREKRQAFEREVAALRKQVEGLQPKQPEDPPDMYVDNDAWFGHKADPLVKQLMSERAARFELARDVAAARYGDETVKAAEQAFDELAAKNAIDPTDYNRIKASANPFRAAVEWHKRQSILKEIGDDPSAYQERLLSDPAFLAKATERARAAAQQNPSVVNLPNSQRATTSLPSVSKMGAAAPIGRQGVDDMDDAALWDTLARPAARKK